MSRCGFICMVRLLLVVEFERFANALNVRDPDKRKKRQDKATVGQMAATATNNAPLARHRWCSPHAMLSLCLQRLFDRAPHILSSPLPPLRVSIALRRSFQSPSGSPRATAVSMAEEVAASAYDANGGEQYVPSAMADEVRARSH